MTTRLGVAALLAGAIGLLHQATVTTINGLQEPIAVDGGQITGTPTILWT